MEYIEGKKIDVSGMTLDEVVYILQKFDANGQKAYCLYEGHVLTSKDITIESAYKEVYGYDSKDAINEVRKLQELKSNRRQFISKEDQSNIDKFKIIREKEKNEGTFEINVYNVIRGLKFMAESIGMPQDEFVDGLINRGCTFTQKDISNAYQEKITLPDDFYSGKIKAGAYLIAIARDSEESRHVIESKYLMIDDDDSIYKYIRDLGGDNSYTKAYADSLNKRRKRL